MKLLTLITLIFLGCINDTEEKSTVLIRYETSAHDIDVTYCKEDGSIGTKFGVYKFEQELHIESGRKACISITKKNPRNNINARVYIYVDDHLVIKDSGEMTASAEWEL